MTLTRTKTKAFYKWHIWYLICLVLTIRKISTASLVSRGLVREFYYLHSENNTLNSAIKNNAKFPKHPDFYELVELFNSTVLGVASPYGIRLRGWFNPPLTGSYMFFTWCNKSCELYFSRTSDQEDKVLIVAPVLEIDNLPDYSLTQIKLVANHSYYFEILVFVRNSANSLNVGVLLPDNESEDISFIPNAWLSPIRIDNINSSRYKTSNNEKCILENGYKVCTCKFGQTFLLDSFYCVGQECEFKSFGGNSEDNCCAFPFVFKGDLYNNCTKIGKEEYWCATTHNYDVDKKWGFCSEFIEDISLRKPPLKFTYNTVFDGKVLTINMKVQRPMNSSVVAHNVTFEYFLPPFFTFISETLMDVSVKTNSSQFRFLLPGAFTFDYISHQTMATLNLEGLIFDTFMMDIPMVFTFQNSMGMSWNEIKTYRRKISNVRCRSAKIAKDANALSENYGSGIYWDSFNSCIYLCMNQYVARSKSACFFSNDEGNTWQELDAVVGSILGHHLVSKELYAIHRNQKTYLVFHKTYRKWLALTNQQFKETKELVKEVQVTLEGSEDRVLLLEPNQWLSNVEGLFHRKLFTDPWILKVKWPP